MQYRRVGKAGLKVSEIALGSWLTYGGTVDSDASIGIIRRAIDLGVNFIDMSDAYSGGAAERVVGKAIEPYTRSDLVLSSKLFWPMSDNINDRGLSRKHIMESIEKSLRRIGTDYLDIYFCHRFDPETEIEETVRAMDDLVRQGKILYWGTSVWEVAQIEQAVSDAQIWRAYQPVVEQPRYNMLDAHIETELFPTCSRHGIGLVVFSPLAQGMLSGKYNNGVPPSSRGGQTKWLEGDLTPENLAKIKALGNLARSLELTMAQLALAWVLRRSEITSAITGATSIDQVDENVTASGVILSNETLETIDGILDGQHVT